MIRKLFVVVCVVFAIVSFCQWLGIDKTLLASPSMPYLRITVSMIISPVAVFWVWGGLRR